MGQRANLILVEGGEYSLYYNHWCANTLDRDLFWGPQYATAFVRHQRAVDPTNWLDDVWCEGGAVVDQDKHVLLLFGGEDVSYEVPLRRVYLRLLQHPWTGWEVRWAHEGIAEMADYVGFPREKVLSKAGLSRGEPCLRLPGEQGWTDIVGTVRLSDGSIRAFPLAGDVASYLGLGLGLVTAMQDSPAIAPDAWHEWIRGVPQGGFHVNLRGRCVEFWTATDEPAIADRVGACWPPDWTVVWHRDRFEAQLDLVPHLRFPTEPDAALVERLRGHLVAEPGRSGAESIVEIAAMLAKRGGPVTVSPAAMQDRRLTPTPEVCEQMVAAAIASLGTANP